MMKRLILPLAVLLILLPFLAAAPHASRAQEDAFTYRCTVGPETWMRECPHWAGCAPIYWYSHNTILFVKDTVTGDRNAGTNEWLLIEDPVQHNEGYVHSSMTTECTPEAWQLLPVVPEVTNTARDIYQRGQELGTDPTRFSKVGDCQNVSAYFLSSFDTPLQYDLGDYEHLQSTIDQFAGSFSRDSAAVEGGFTVASVLSPLWADPARCDDGETPLECEARLHNPSIVIISMETWSRETAQPSSLYQEYLMEVVAFWIDRGVVPILATKADNIEGDHSINQAIVEVAATYDIPLWNFWLAAHTLPKHGLSNPELDQFHLLWGRSFYNNPDRLRDGWPVRNLTALQSLDAVWRTVTADE
ncbi:MAG: hypothetical protein GYB65_06520 [Chloroflexi bacterium]|nr:hypothetical protein [Chloroflexota bacterium]